MATSRAGEVTLASLFVKIYFPMKVLNSFTPTGTAVNCSLKDREQMVEAERGGEEEKVWVGEKTTKRTTKANTSHSPFLNCSPSQKSKFIFSAESCRENVFFITKQCQNAFQQDASAAGQSVTKCC